MAGFSIGGIASGFDTATMIRQLMQVERQPIMRIEQRQAQLRKVDDAWGEVVTRLSAFRSALDDVRDSQDWSSFLTVASSNEDAVQVTSSGSGDPGSLDMTVTSLASRHQVMTAGPFSSGSALVGAGSLAITDENQAVVATITTDSTTTLDDLARMIDDAGVGVDAQVLKVADGEHRLMLQSTETGAAAEFSIDSTNLTSIGASTVARAASDAELNVAGAAVTRPSNTITDLLEGVTIELRAETTSPVTVSSSRDTTKAADAVEAMVTAANDVLSILNEHTDYNAENGTAGVLQGDAAARSLKTQIRNLLSDTAGTGTITHGSQIGMSLTRSGSVEVGRSELEQALADDYAGVSAFMVDGLGLALDGYLDTVEGSGGSIQRARDAIDGRIRTFDDQIEDLEVRMQLRETTLRRQFTSMETALAELQSQGSWLAGQLGSLPGA